MRIAQDLANLIESSWRLMASTHLYINLKKQFGHCFAFDAPTVFGMIYLIMFFLPPRLSVLGKKLNSYFSKKVFTL